MNNLIKFGSVGVMDSGIGGLNVLKTISESNPKLNLVYYGDNLNAPYGNKSLRELKKLATNAVGYLLDNNAKIIVVACNTLSTSILDYIKAISPVPVIPTLPINSIKNCDYKSPCLIATPNTINSLYVQTNFNKFNLIPLPFLAGEIERYIFSPNKISVEKDLNALPENADYLYLGCTHYIFIKDRIKKALNIVVEDNSIEVYNNLNKSLLNAGVKNMKGKGIITFIGKSSNYNYSVFKRVAFPKCSNKIIVNP